MVTVNFFYYFSQSGYIFTATPIHLRRMRKIRIYKNLYIAAYIQKLSVLRSRSRWRRNYLIPEAGAEIISLINIFCRQFGGC